MQYTLTQETSGNETATYGHYKFNFVTGNFKELFNSAIATACWARLESISPIETYNQSYIVVNVRIPDHSSCRARVYRQRSTPDILKLRCDGNSGPAMDFLKDSFAQWETEYGCLLQGLASLLQTEEIKTWVKGQKGLQCKVSDLERICDAVAAGASKWHRTHISPDGEITERTNEASLWATIQAMDWALVELHQKVTALQVKPEPWYKRIRRR